MIWVRLIHYSKIGGTQKVKNIIGSLSKKEDGR